MFYKYFQAYIEQILMATYRGLREQAADAGRKAARATVRFGRYQGMRVISETIDLRRILKAAGHTEGLSLVVSDKTINAALRGLVKGSRGRDELIASFKQGIQEGRTGAVPFLVTNLWWGDEGRRDAAAEILYDAGFETARLDERDIILTLLILEKNDELVDRVRDRISGSIDGLIKALEHCDKEIQERAVGVLSEIVSVDERITKALCKRFSKAGRKDRWQGTALQVDVLGEQEEIQGHAAQVLGQVKDKGAVTDLIKELGTAHRPVLFRIIKSLGSIGDIRAVKPLTLVLIDKRIEVSREAQKALETIYDTAVSNAGEPEGREVLEEFKKGLMNGMDEWTPDEKIEIIDHSLIVAKERATEVVQELMRKIDGAQRMKGAYGR